MTTEQENTHSQNLKAAQQSSKNWGVSDTAKNMAETANPVGAVSLLGQVSIFKDLPFVVAFGAAILKDVLDLAVVGSLPGIGTVLSIMAGITIFFMMLLSGNNGKRKAVGGMMKQGLVLVMGTLFEAVGFGLNFFPMQTATVFVIYFMVLSDRKKATMQNFGG